MGFWRSGCEADEVHFAAVQPFPWHLAGGADARRLAPGSDSHDARGFDARGICLEWQSIVS